MEAPTLNGDMKRRDWLAVPEVVQSGKPRLDLTSVQRSGRAGWTSPRARSEWGCLPRNTWETRTGLAHPIVLAREGHAVIESFPAFRSNGLTLRPVEGDEEDLIYVCDTLLDTACPLRILDFLSFREIPPLNLSARCASESISDDVTAVHPPNQHDTPHKSFTEAPLDYHNFFIQKSAVSPAVSSYCSLLGDCMSSATQSELSTSEPPWRLCSSDCWFTYQVFDQPRDSDSLTLLPARFDEAMRVDVRGRPELKLDVFSYRGLAAVDLSDITVPIELTVSLDTDMRQMRTALIPYQMLAALILCGIALWRNSGNTHSL